MERFSQIIKAVANQNKKVHLTIFNSIAQSQRIIKLRPNLSWPKANSYLGCLIRTCEIEKIKKTIFKITKIGRNQIVDDNNICLDDFIVWTRNTGVRNEFEILTYLSQSPKNYSDVILYNASTNLSRNVVIKEGTKNCELGCELVVLSKYKDYEETQYYMNQISNLYNTPSTPKSQPMSSSTSIENTQKVPMPFFKKNTWFYSSKSLFSTFSVPPTPQTKIAASLLTQKQRVSLSQTIHNYSFQNPSVSFQNRSPMASTSAFSGKDEILLNELQNLLDDDHGELNTPVKSHPISRRESALKSSIREYLEKDNYNQNLKSPAALPSEAKLVISKGKAQDKEDFFFLSNFTHSVSPFHESVPDKNNIVNLEVLNLETENDHKMDSADLPSDQEEIKNSKIEENDGFPIQTNSENLKCPNLNKSQSGIEAQNDSLDRGAFSLYNISSDKIKNIPKSEIKKMSRSQLLAFQRSMKKYIQDV